MKRGEEQEGEEEEEEEEVKEEEEEEKKHKVSLFIFLLFPGARFMKVQPLNSYDIQCRIPQWRTRNQISRMIGASVHPLRQL